MRYQLLFLILAAMPLKAQNTLDGAKLFNLAYDLNKRADYIYTQRVMRDNGFRLIEKHLEGRDFRYLYTNASRDTLVIGDYGSVGFASTLSVDSEEKGRQAFKYAKSIGFTSEGDDDYYYTDGHCSCWVFDIYSYWIYGREVEPDENNDIMSARYAIDYCEDCNDWTYDDPESMFYLYRYEYAKKDNQGYYYWTLGCKLTHDFKPTAFKKQTSSIVKANRGRNREISIRFFNTNVANRYTAELQEMGFTGSMSDKYEDITIFKSNYSPFVVYLVTDKGGGHQRLGGYYLIVSRTTKDL